MYLKSILDHTFVPLMTAPLIERLHQKRKKGKNNSRPIEWLPPGLLEEVLTYTSVRDILRVKLLNHYFNKLIKMSPYIGYRIKLFVAGLEENPASDVPLTEKRMALAEYHARWDAFDPIKKPGRKIKTLMSSRVQTSGSRVLCFPAAMDNSIRFMVTESIPRGIPEKEWDFLFPSNLSVKGFAVCPQADVMAVVFQEHLVQQPGGTTFSRPSVYLRRIMTGKPHPGAKPTQFLCPRGNSLISVRSTSITNSRFAMLVSPGSTDSNSDMYVWDWRTGQIILEKTGCDYFDLTFVNEHSFIVLSKSFSHLKCHVFDTECRTEPTETIFFIPSSCTEDIRISHLSEPCGYAPSPYELIDAPFYPDPSQRITVFDLVGVITYVVNTELLLEIARERRGRNIEWNEWGGATMEVKIRRVRESGNSVCVSGCRMFCMVKGDEGSCLQVYDFSHRGRARNLQVPDGVDKSERKRRMSPAIGSYKLPSNWNDHHGWNWILNAGHDSITFYPSDTEPDRDPHSMISNRTMYLLSV